MQKLLELLNEYENLIGTNRVWGGVIDEDTFLCTRKSKKGNPIIQHSSQEDAIAQIISKHFGFIKRLVLSLKIDIDKLGRHGYIVKTYDLDELGETYDYTDSLLMLLAIQDNPIEFLISIIE